MTLNIATANVISLAVCSHETKSKLVYFFFVKNYNVLFELYENAQL